MYELKIRNKSCDSRSLALLHAPFLPPFQFFLFFLFVIFFFWRSRSDRAAVQFRNKLRWQLSNHAVSNETSSTREVSQLESPLRHAIITLHEIALCGLGRIAPMGTISDLGAPRRENVESEYLETRRHSRTF